MAKKPYTFDELLFLLDSEFQWRRKELYLFKSKIPIDKTSLQKAFLRAGITMLYAHTEGYIKNVSTYYLQFVSFKFLKYNELNSSFLSVCLKNKFNNLQNIEKQIELINFFFNDISLRSNLPHKNIINTRSNLSFHVLEEILTTIGLRVTNFERRQSILDDLLVLRNTIAHGEFKDIDLQTYTGFYDEIESFMNQYKTEIENSALLGSYRR